MQVSGAELRYSRAMIGWSCRYCWLPAWALLFVVSACGGDKPPAAPQRGDKQRSEQAVDLKALHTQLVQLHKSAVVKCFGGFGKGAPYALKLTMAQGKVAKVGVTTLNEKHRKLPDDCLRDAFAGEPLGGGAINEIEARFAVDNPDCDVRPCHADDAACGIKRDIACSVVIDDSH